MGVQNAPGQVGAGEQTRAAIQTGATALMAALAEAVRDYGTEASSRVLLEGAVDRLLDAIYGGGRADLVEGLLEWWFDLDDEGRARSGVQVVR